jgi:4-aminobutyrate aminotransferase-like enzyme
VVCAAGLKVLEIIERDNLRMAAVKLGNHLVSALREARIPHVSEVRAIGLMVGIQLDKATFPQGPRPPALEAVVRSMGEGLLAIPAGETVVRFLPPLNVTDGEIEEAVKKFAAAIEKLENGQEPASLHHP